MGRPPRIGRDSILEAAEALAREDGARVTMRGVARRLGVDPGALYGHVGSRSELLAALADRLGDQAPLPDPVDSSPEDWRAACLGACRAIRTALSDHPELALLDGEQPGLTAFNARATALLLGALAGSGLPAAERIEASQNLLYQVTALARVERSLAGRSAEDVVRYHRAVAGRLDGDVADAWDALMQAPARSNFDRLLERGVETFVRGLSAPGG